MFQASCGTHQRWTIEPNVDHILSRLSNVSGTCEVVQSGHEDALCTFDTETLSSNRDIWTEGFEIHLRYRDASNAFIEMTDTWTLEQLELYTIEKNKRWELKNKTGAPDFFLTFESDRSVGLTAEFISLRYESQGIVYESGNEVF